MNLTIYTEAVAELAIPRLTAFLKAQSDTVEIENWSKMRAPEKRESLLEAFKQSKELRKEFVGFYAEDKGTDSDFSEWETADLPKTEEQDFPEPPTGTGQTSTAVSEPAKQTTTVYVEGAFEDITAGVAGLDAEQSRINLIEAEDRMEFEHIRIGAILSHIQASQHYQTLGYDNLKEFLAAHTAMDYRKGTYLISNYNKVRDLEIPASDLKGVTWSALRHIVPVLNKENYKEWLDMARSQTHISMIQAVSAEKAKLAGALPAPTGESDETPKAIVKTFNVMPDQNVTISGAIDKAKIEGHVDSNGAALEIIASAYTGQPISDSTVGLVLPDTSHQGLVNMMSKMKADSGYEAAKAILIAFGEVFEDVDIEAKLPETATAA